jgi:hypothetical protein
MTMAKMTEAWAIEVGGLKVSGTSNQATTVTIDIYTPGAGFGPTETPEEHASITVSADDWRDIVGAVERKLIQRGDTQR